MIHFIVGTEAELIKIFPLMIEFKKKKIDYNFISTGQHNLMENDVLKEFGLKNPDFVLYGGSPFVSIPEILFWFTKSVIKFAPRSKEVFKGDTQGLVIVHGDTPSTLLGAILVRMHGLRLAHLEAGLRSSRILNPFPEELTRRIVSRMAHVHFCSGKWAMDNLKGVGGEKVNTNFNTLLDSLRYVKRNINKTKDNELPKRYFVFILHRHETLYSLSNHGTVVKLMKLLQKWSSEMPAVFVVHHTTAARLNEYGLLKKIGKNSRIKIVARQSYPKFTKILINSEFIATDGGSNQEESYYIGIPCLILRKSTERIEGIGENVVLSGLDFKIISKFFVNYKKYRRKAFVSKVSPSKIIFNYLVKRNYA